jgi:hypothetical protein
MSEHTGRTGGHQAAESSAAAVDRTHAVAEAAASEKLLRWIDPVTR